jgi:hypothetical protein
MAVNAFMEEAGFHQEFTQFVANAGLTDFLAAEIGYRVMPEDIIAYGTTR